MNNSSASKDLHYLISKVINPILNSIIAKLHDSKFIHYRDGTLDVTEYSTSELVAKSLKEWRDNLWYKYSKKDLTEASEEILFDYSREVNYVYFRLYSTEKSLAEEIKGDLILLGQKIEEYLTGKVGVFSNFMFDVEKSNSLQMEKPQETPKSQTKPSKLKEEESPDFGVCSRCAVYEGDKSKKKLYQCPYCGEWFCEKHVKPSLVLTFGKYRELWSKYKDLREFLDNEWHREDGHPCYPYTQKFWREYDRKNTSSSSYSGKFSSSKEIEKLDFQELWSPKNYTRYDNVIINIKKRLKDLGSVYVTPKEIYIETPTIKKVIPRSPSIRFEIRDGKRWVIIPEDLYLRSTSIPKSTPSIKRQEKPGRKKQKSKGKYIAVVVAILLLILVGYLYSQGSFDNIGIPIFGKFGNSSQETNTYMPSYTNTRTPIQTTTTPTTTETPALISEAYCSSGYWRYIFEDALRCALTQEELSKISYFAEELKGGSLQESVWNTLEWLDENIEYDYYKASLPDPIIWKYPDGTIKEITGGEGKEFQTPYETIQKGKGVCSDYTILTAALLLEMDYSPVYVFDIDFENSETRHAATAVKINGEYFILDQHPPAMDLGTYYRHMSVYREETLGEALFISTAKVYEVRQEGDSVLVRTIGTLSADDFKQRDYKFSFVDLTKISEDLKRTFKEHHPNLILDTNIANLDKRSYLPVGYSDGITWRVEFPHYVDYYNPVFHKQFVEYLYTNFANDSRLKYDLQRFNRFWVKIEQREDSLVVTLNLARK